MPNGETVIHRAVRGATGRARAARHQLLGSLVRVQTREPVAALTFDDGPHPEYTPRLLEILEAHSARGTFFMVGANADRYRNLVKRVAVGGHAVGNHSWDHPEFPAISARERREQLRACARATAPYGGPFFRPPYVLQSVGSFLTARRLGYRVVAFSVEVEDWREHEAGWMAERMLARIEPGSIVLLHDAIFKPSMGATVDRGALLEAVERVLRSLADRFRFVTIPELLRYGRPALRPWFVRTHAEWPSPKQAELECPA